MIALIPARAGSKRLPGKNTRLLAGHPLIAYTIAAAQQSRVFSSIYCCTDDQDAGALAAEMDCEIIVRTPVSDDQPDVVWVRYAISHVGPRPDSFAILRPTSPFRTAATIRRAVGLWKAWGRSIDSLRAVRPVTEHPGKMWTTAHGVLTPLLPKTHPAGTPWHSSPTQTLPAYFVQTGGLEIAWTSTVETYGSISGRIIAAFFCEGPETLDLNTPADWDHAEAVVASGAATLPPVSLAPLSPDPEASAPPDPDRAVAGGGRL